MRTKVLIADSDPWVIRHARHLMAYQADRYELKVADDGAGARAVIELERPAVSLLGDGLRTPTALELVAFFTRERAYDRCRFVALVREDQASAVAPMLDAGASGYLLKPFDSELFRATVAELTMIGDSVAAATFMIVLAPPGAGSPIRRALEEQGHVVVCVENDADFALALARSPRVRAIFLVEPVASMSTEALVEYVRAQNVHVPIVRVGDGLCPHPSIASLSARFHAIDLRRTIERFPPPRPATSGGEGRRARGGIRLNGAASARPSAA